MNSFVVLAVASVAVVSVVNAGTPCTAYNGPPCTSSQNCNSPFKVLKCQVCKGFNGPVTVTSVVATQGGKTVDANGGINVLIPMKLTAQITNHYNKPVANVRVDVDINVCRNFFGCRWHSYPTLGLTHNLNPCSADSGVTLTDCHFQKNPTTSVININVNLKDNPALSALLEPVESTVKGHDVQLTIKIINGDTNEVLTCVDAWDKAL